jgi:hypothetical protein
MRLERVTITGADDGTRPEQLAALSANHPFVEWGVLLCQSYEGKRPLYPSLVWLERLRELAAPHGLKVAGHLCGGWVKRLVCEGHFDFLAERGSLRTLFQRMQINYKPYRSRLSAGRFLPALEAAPGRAYVFQAAGPADVELARQARARGVEAVVLFDRSGGRGRAPKSWPEAPPDVPCGYAGGLGPDELEGQIEQIAAAAGDARVWVDVQSKVRTADGERLDLEKVDRLLTVAARWVG